MSDNQEPSAIFSKIETLVRDAREDVVKFYSKGNSAAGTRVRKHMQELKKLAQELRVDVQSHKNKDKPKKKSSAKKSSAKKVSAKKGGKKGGKKKAKK